MIELEADQQTIADTLESTGLADDFNNKSLAIAAFFQNIESDIVAMKEAEKRIADRRKSKENQVKNLKEYLLRNMQCTGITKIECPEFSISLRNNPESVEILDESLIPDEFMTVKEVKTPNKTLIKEFGGCAGAEIVRKQSVHIK